MTEPIHNADYKRCSAGNQCIHPEGPWLPVTPEYFHRQCSTKSGFQSRCRACILGTSNPSLPRQSYDVPEGMQRCSRGDKCLHPEGPILPATSEYFHRDRSKKSGFHNECRACKLSTNNPQTYSKPPVPDGMKYCIWGDECRHPEGPILPATREYFYKADTSDGLEGRCKRCKLVRSKAATDPLYSKAYYQANKAQRAEYQKARLPIRRLNNQRRKARLRELPDVFTFADWQRALEYFGGCAITGTTENLHADHWIPLSSPNCPGTVPGNIIPLCAELNISKNDSAPYEWLVRRFGEEEARRIWERINGYFEWLLK